MPKAISSTTNHKRNKEPQRAALIAATGCLRTEEELESHMVHLNVTILFTIS